MQIWSHYKFDIWLARNGNRVLFQKIKTINLIVFFFDSIIEKEFLLISILYFGIVVLQYNELVFMYSNFGCLMGFTCKADCFFLYP